MSIWSRVSAAIAEGTDAVLDVLAKAHHLLRGGNASERRAVAFTIAMIALAAKMAKADGIVTDDEVTAFQDLFEIPEQERANVARLYNLARRDVAGFEIYARRLAALYESETFLLEDILDGLFHIATADGVVHEMELSFLETVGRIFGIEGPAFERIRLRHVSTGTDAYAVLGADRSWSDEDLKRRYRDIVSENHPDRMLARGLPAPFIRMANDKLSAVNASWAEIKAERGLA